VTQSNIQACAIASPGIATPWISPLTCRSPPTINIARQFGAQYNTPLSVGDVKVLLHNAAMVERLFSMFGNSPNLKINNTDFKELLFYGVRAAA